MAQILDFKKDYIGLNDEDYEENLEIFGQNTSLAQCSPSISRKIIAQAKSPAFILMLVSVLVLVILSSYIQAVILVVIALLSAIAMLFLDMHTYKAAMKLHDLTGATANVIRGGIIYTEACEKIVPNDLLLLQEGELVPADAIIEEAIDFYVDEGTLIEDAGISLKLAGAPICAHFIVTKGRCIAKVTATGTRTSAYKNGKIPQEKPMRPNNLEQKAKHTISLCFILALVLVIPAFAIANYHSSSFSESTMSASALVLSLIPFPVVIMPTSLLISGAIYLSKTGRIIKRLSTVKSLAGVSVICADASSGLAQGKMEVVATSSMSDELLLNIACLTCVKGSNDPIDKAVLSYCKSKGASVEMLQSNLLLHEYHFSLKAKLMGKVWDISSNKLVCIKGLPESILPLCALDEQTHYSIRAKQSDFERQGLRVFVICCYNTEGDIPEDITDCKLTYVGLIGVRDEIPSTVVASVASCKRAGIRVVMLTEDNPDTAVVMAGNIGIDLIDGIVTGKMLDNCEDEDLGELCKSANIFAQISSAHRPIVVRGLKKAGETVLISAKGYEDYSMLKTADICVAPSDSLPAVRDMADAILPDSRFITVVRAVSEARHVCNTVISSIGNIIALHLTLVLIALILPMIGYSLPITPSGIILLEACLAISCFLMPVRNFDKNAMSSPSICMGGKVQKSFIVKPLIQAAVIAVLLFISYIAFSQSGAIPTHAAGRSYILVFLLMAAVSLTLINSTSASIFTISTLSTNAPFVFIGSILLSILLCYAPGMSVVFGTSHISATLMIVSILLGVACALWWEVAKLFRNKINNRLSRFFHILIHGNKA